MTADVLEEASRALFQLGRTFARMPLRGILASPTGRGVELSSILVVQAIAAAAGEEQEPVVGVVAARLAIDPSTASRVVAATEKAGFICRIVSPADGRVRSLELTDRGRELERHAAAYQRAVFAAATADWSDAERREFARFFVRFSTAIVAAVNAERAL